MSVDYRSIAMIGCEVTNFDPDNNYNHLAAKGLYWAQRGSYFSGKVDPYVIGLEKYLVCAEIGSQRIVLTKEELACAYVETKEVLEAECLWDESTFGLWAIGILS